MSPLSSRERVLMTIEHQEPDQVPLIIGADLTTGIQVMAYQRLKTALGIDANDRYLYDWQELGAVDPDEKILQRLGSDARGVHDHFPRWIYEMNRTRIANSPHIDDWGVGSPEISPGNFYPGIHPLQNAKTIKEIETYQYWPDMNDADRVLGVAERVARLAEDNQYAIIGSPWLMFPMERATQLQGMETFFVSLAQNPDFAIALLQHISELCKTHMGHFLKAAGNNLDLIVIGDDLGTQESLLISPRMYRKLVKPIHADYIAFIKANTKAKIYFHTDGDVFPLLDDLVEIGVDVLNPIQTSAGRMADLKTLKQRYGMQLTFCGGVDTQRLLPYGTPEEIRTEIKRLIELLSPGGGYLLASVHSITNDVPPDNILAMVAAVQEFGKY